MALGLLSWCTCVSWKKQYIERMEKEQMWWSMDHKRVLWQHSEQLHYSLSVWLLIGCYCAYQHSNSLLWFKCLGKHENAIIIYLSWVFSLLSWFGQESDVNGRRTLKSLLWYSWWGEVIKFSNQTSWVGWRSVGREKECFILPWPCQPFL